MQLFQGLLGAVGYDAQVKPHPSLRCRFRDAGHILGSATIELSAGPAAGQTTRLQ